MFGTFIAGISFADDLARLAVLQLKNRAVTLRYLGEYARTGPAELWFLDELLARKHRILRKVSRASVAVDHGAAIELCFPSDSSLSGADGEEHIGWELSNLIPGFRAEDYTSEKHLLQTHAHLQYSDLLVVAYRKSFVESARRLLGAKNIDLAGVGTNYFGAQHALFLNNPEVGGTMVALVHVMRNRVDVGLINCGRLVHYRTARIESENGVLEFMKARVSPFPVSGMFFHGGSVSSGLLKEAREGFPFTVATLNPFKGIGVDSSFREFDAYLGKEHLFAAAVGTALQNQ